MLFARKNPIPIVSPHYDMIISGTTFFSCCPWHKTTFCQIIDRRYNFNAQKNQKEPSPINIHLHEQPTSTLHQHHFHLKSLHFSSIIISLQRIIRSFNPSRAQKSTWAS